MPKIQNTVATASVGCVLDLKTVALHARNTEYNPKRFAAVIMRIRSPKTTCLIFRSGKIVITGAKSIEQSQFAGKKFCKILAKIGFPTSFQGFKIQNIVGSCDLKSNVRLEGLAFDTYISSSFEPEVFPGLVYRMIAPKIVILVFVSGKMVITGAKTTNDVFEGFTKFYPVVTRHLFQCGTGSR